MKRPHEPLHENPDRPTVKSAKIAVQRKPRRLNRRDARCADAIPMTVPSPRPKRYPTVEDCTWCGGGKCRNLVCRYSLLAERPRIAEWAPEDLEELVAALPSTCCLDLAALGPMLLDEVVAFLGLARPQVEQLELAATRKLARLRELRRAHWDGH